MTSRTSASALPPIIEMDETAAADDVKTAVDAVKLGLKISPEIGCFAFADAELERE